MMRDNARRHPPVEYDAIPLPVLPLKRARIEAYLNSKFLYERLFFAGLHDRCLLACVWLFDHPGDVASIGSDAAIMNNRCYRLSDWQAREVRRLDGAFAQGAEVTKRQYLALAEKGESRRRRARR